MQRLQNSGVLPLSQLVEHPWFLTDEILYKSGMVTWQLWAGGLILPHHDFCGDKARECWGEVKDKGFLFPCPAWES